jgi:peptidyl-dipeptidase Dcp
MTNPLLQTWRTPHGMPPFDDIKTEHFLPAFEQAFTAHQAEITLITTSDIEPDFNNTVAAMERSGRLLDQITAVFFSLTSTNTNDTLQAIETEIMPRLSAHYSAIYTNQALYQRVYTVYSDRSGLDDDQMKLVEDLYRGFVRSGAALGDEQRHRVQNIDEQLASLSTAFSQNILGDTNDFELFLNEEEVAGLPGLVKQAGADAAANKGQSGYLFTISRSSITPFLQFAERRDLREKIYNAYTNCGNNDNENNNAEVLTSTADLRLERATIMGYASHAHFSLDERMAQHPDRVTELLDEIWQPAIARAKQEADDLQQCIQDDGGNFTLAPWDWWYYTEKIRKARFDLDEESIKPYFKLEQVRDGAFNVAEELYGIRFTVIETPVYHPDVTAYEVTERDGTLIGVFLTDYHMRASKRGGAWMTGFREQSNMDEAIYPIVVNCCNFPKSDPCLLGMDEVRTLFHEFGHALHGLLSRVRYPGQSGTSVKQDFVELPSQIMEHWAIEPEVLRRYAHHYETGEVIPDALIEKLLAADTFNQGFATTEYLAACYLDMAWHGELDQNKTIESIETKAMNDIGLIDAIGPRYNSTYFQHIFAGSSYSAGYYAYIWAEVLDADGFEAFKEAGIFDQQTAASFRTNILEKGGTKDPMDLYRRFRGRDPEVAPLLKNRGL